MNTDESAGTTTSNTSGINLPTMDLVGGMRLDAWRKIVGLSRTTAWRYRKEGKLPVVVRYGIAYVTADTIRNFFTNDGTKPRAFAMKSAPCS